MAKYRVEFFIDAAQIGSAQKRINTMLKKEFGKEVADVVDARVTKLKTATSRSDRLGEAQSATEGAHADVEELRDELQEWYDNMPENLQGSMKGDELQEAIDQLEQIASDLDNIDWDVTFPGMF